MCSSNNDLDLNTAFKDKRTTDIQKPADVFTKLLDGEDDDDLIDAETPNENEKFKRGTAGRTTILTSPRGVNTNNTSNVKTLLGS